MTNNTEKKTYEVKPGEFFSCPIAKKLNLEYGKSFSLCDVDMMFRKEYISASKHYTRCVIVESKHDNEPISDAQYKSLAFLHSIIDWSKCDEKSGVFIVRHYNECESVKIYNIAESTTESSGKIPFDVFYQWIDAQDKAKH
jgi:hypothetical protein